MLMQITNRSARFDRDLTLIIPKYSLFLLLRSYVVWHRECWSDGVMDLCHKHQALESEIGNI